MAGTPRLMQRPSASTFRVVAVAVLAVVVMALLASTLFGGLLLLAWPGFVLVALAAYLFTRNVER